MNDDEDVPLEEPYDPTETFDCPFVAFDSDVLRGVAQKSMAMEGLPVRRSSGNAAVLNPGTTLRGLPHRNDPPVGPAMPLGW